MALVFGRKSALISLIFKRTASRLSEMVGPSVFGMIIGLIPNQLPPRLPSFQFSENDLVADIIADNAWCIPSQLPFRLQEFLSHSTNLIPISTERDNIPDSLSWPGSSSGVFSMKAAWIPWHKLIWNNLINPRIACTTSRLLLRRTLTDSWAKSKGCSLASRFYNCFNDEEKDFHLFFSCNLATNFWHWLLSQCGPILPLLSVFL